MKRLLTLALSLTLSSALGAQDSVPLSWPGEPFELEVRVMWGALELRSADSEVRLTADKVTLVAEDDEGRPARIVVEEEENRVVVRQPPPAEGVFTSANLVLEVPPGGRVSLLVERGGDVVVRGLDADLEITNHNGSVDVLDHRGSVVVNATNGTIRAQVVEPNERPLLFATLNGSAHVCLGGEPQRDVLLSTQDDQLVTEFDIERELPAVSLYAGQVVVEGVPMLRGTIGGGGPLLRIATSNGDILLQRCR